ncbi:MAG TPA: POTRA domain-containing protein, partial [Prolixibacteraceae bacterium]|nr:POTRA domain-containing protein [Prolixibacteraceae bacterium]
MAIAFLFGCNTTKYVPDDRYLLNDIDISTDNRNINKEELSSYVRQKENLKILQLFKFHLWVYNLSRKDKEKGWFKRIGEPPVIYDEAMKNKSREQLTQYLNNKGYYRAQVNDSLILKDKKARLLFEIESGEPYRIDEFTYRVNDTVLAPFFNRVMRSSLINKNDVFDVDVLQKERERITERLKNNGYFKFAEEFIHYKVDTTKVPFKVNVEMLVENANIAVEIDHENHMQYFLSDYEIFIEKPGDSLAQYQSEYYSDTLVSDGFTFYYNGRNPIKESVLKNAFDIQPGNLYRKSLEDRTYNNLYALRQFKYVNIQYQVVEDNADSLNGYLQGRVYLPL